MKNPYYCMYLCVILVAVFSVGFVGTIAESIRALLIYACLLILFPVSILMVEIILRLSAMSTPAAPPVTGPPPTEQSLSTSLAGTPKSTVIFSNSFTSNSLGQPYSPPLSSAERNWSANSISATPASPLYALLPSPSFASPSIEARFNLSTRSPLPTDFYLLFKDGYLDNDDQSKVSSPVRANHTIDSLTLPDDTGQAKSPKSIFLKASNNFWSDILTASLSPQIETLVEYVLIGMLAFVLLQIAIAYLLASEIRTLRTELAMFTSTAMPQHKSRLEFEVEAEEPHLLLATELEATNLTPFEKDAYASSAYTCELQCFDPSSQLALPLRQHLCPSTAAADHSVSSYGPDFSNKPSQFASIVSSSSSSSSSALTSKTNRRNRMGSFRVTFAGEPLTESGVTSTATTEELERQKEEEQEESSERHRHSTYYQTVPGLEMHQQQHQQQHYQS
ncbi:hypothetical protein TYRP_000436 [Tyrophagus putrescentiae]|nr:hypothetical protein TYRP_000436 [Tyrophagus putrescentiae]